MNRDDSKCVGVLECVPRRRGDEPGGIMTDHGYGDVFPAGAGMNRGRQCTRELLKSVPRRRGDEPFVFPSG